MQFALFVIFLGNQKRGKSIFGNIKHGSAYTVQIRIILENVTSTKVLDTYKSVLLVFALGFPDEWNI